ncbi:MAG: hypothetical protein LBS53_14990 [Synergistaceae bacterium]|jgi:hypothetical protein|nr:hypothetical protein [Synergistaceae bacterium]
MEEKDYAAPDFDILYRELGGLRGEFAVLYEELEFINRVLIPRIQTNYLIKIGALRVELLLAQVNMMKARRMIALMRSAIDKGGVLSPDALDRRLEREFREWDKRMAHEAAQIEGAKARFSSLSPSEEENDVRAIFRALCRKMNPDINPDQSDEAKGFWPSVYSAYTSGDLFHLKALLMMSDDYPDSYDMPCNMGAMRENRAALKVKINMIEAQLQNAKQHPVFEWMSLLGDAERLGSEQNRLRSEIGRVKAQHSALLDMQRSLEQRGARR